MAQIDIPINGRIYQVNCADGQETHVGRLGRYVDKKVGELVRSVDQPVDARIFLMASLLIADELAEAEEKLAQEASQPRAEPVPRGTDGKREQDAAILAATIDTLTERIQAIAAALEED